MAYVPMPKAPVHKDGNAVRRKYEIGVAGQVFPMKSKSVSGRVYSPADENLWPSIAAANSRHISASLG